MNMGHRKWTKENIKYFMALSRPQRELHRTSPILRAVGYHCSYLKNANQQLLSSLELYIRHLVWYASLDNCVNKDGS